jgi:hypothetical protein
MRSRSLSSPGGSTVTRSRSEIAEMKTLRSNIAEFIEVTTDMKPWLHVYAAAVSVIVVFAAGHLLIFTHQRHWWGWVIVAVLAVAGEVTFEVMRRRSRARNGCDLRVSRAAIRRTVCSRWRGLGGGGSRWLDEPVENQNVGLCSPGVPHVDGVENVAFLTLVDLHGYSPRSFSTRQWRHVDRLELEVRTENT